VTDTTLPAPLVPAEVDLTDFAFMPLEVQRLRNSELASDETPESCWAAVLLWCAAWHEVPAASIPDNDQWQAKQAGYVARGRVDPQWAKVRAGALRNFVACSDGRLYHSTLAKKALESWESKMRHAYGKMLDRLRKLNKARADKQLQPLPAPAFDAWISAGRLDPVPPEVDGKTDGIPPEKGLKGIEGTGRSKGQGDLLPPSEAGGSAPSAAPPTPPPAFDGTNAETLNGKAVVALASTFDLPEAWGFDAEALGFKPIEVNREAERFRQYWTVGKGKGTRRSVKGWRQSWSNWLGKAGRDVR
jgi:hypothetical protein